METSTRNSTITALINMLDDPDNRVYDLIREKLISLGNDALLPLETAIDNCIDDQLNERMVAVRDEINIQILGNELTEWKLNNSDNLLKGYILGSRFGNPDLDEVEILSQIAQLKTDIWIELHDGLTPLEKVRVVNHLLFKIHRFEGAIEHISGPEFSFIQYVLKNRKGSPLSLGLVYLILCQQLDLPVYGVNLPQHFILAYLSGKPASTPKTGDILFYINPFNNGGVFTKHEIDHYITQLKIQSEPSFYLPCSNPELIKRLLNNLLFIFKSKGEDKKINEIETLLYTLK